MAACVEDVKVVLEEGRPTTHTVTTLSGLLGLEDRKSQAPDTAARSRLAGTGPKSSSISNAKPSVARTKKQMVSAIPEDSSQALSGRDKYALATHAVNHGLKVLSSSLKPRTSSQIAASSPNPGPLAHKADVTPARALQPRSGNISPVRSSPKKASIDAKLFAKIPAEGTSCRQTSSVQAIAQCTQHGFAFLLSTDCKPLGVREMPQWQLENGLLAFIGSLSSHGLDKTPSISETRLHHA